MVLYRKERNGLLSITPVIIWVMVKNALLMYPYQQMVNMLLTLVESGILRRVNSYYISQY